MDIITRLKNIVLNLHEIEYQVRQNAQSENPKKVELWAQVIQLLAEDINAEAQDLSVREPQEPEESEIGKAESRNARIQRMLSSLRIEQQIALSKLIASGILSPQVLDSLQDTENQDR